MAAIHETVYTRFKNNFTKDDMIKFYSPNNNEINNPRRKRTGYGVAENHCYNFRLSSFKIQNDYRQKR